MYVNGFYNMHRSHQSKCKAIQIPRLSDALQRLKQMIRGYSKIPIYPGAQEVLIYFLCENSVSEIKIILEFQC